MIRQFKHGQSNPTYYISYGGAEMVLRKKPVRERGRGGEGEGREGRERETKRGGGGGLGMEGG